MRPGARDFCLVSPLKPCEMVIWDFACALTSGSESAIRYSERLAEAGIEPSVGSKGDSCDHALVETINGLYKAQP